MRYGSCSYLDGECSRKNGQPEQSPCAWHVWVKVNMAGRTMDEGKEVRARGENRLPYKPSKDFSFGRLRREALREDHSGCY